MLCLGLLGFAKSKAAGWVSQGLQIFSKTLASEIDTRLPLGGRGHFELCYLHGPAVNWRGILCAQLGAILTSTPSQDSVVRLCKLLVESMSPSALADPARRSSFPTFWLVSRMPLAYRHRRRSRRSMQIANPLLTKNQG